MPGLKKNSYRINFADLPSPLTDPRRSMVKIFSIPYEATTSYRGGTKQGPEAIICASQNLELWDEELGMQPCKVGISTFPPLKCSAAGPEIAVGQIYEYTKDILSKYPDRFYIFLGGEHTITSGIVKAFLEAFPSLSVLQLDAHADLRETYEGTGYNHACVMRRLAEKVSFLQLGTRSLSREEAKYIDQRNLTLQSAHRVITCNKWKQLIQEKLSDSVYLTIDVDVLDPSIMPSVGTPEPGGLDWYKTLEILRYLIGHKKVVGVDVVELSPLPGIIAPDFLVAKLIYKIIGYIIFSRKNKSG